MFFLMFGFVLASENPFRSEVRVKEFSGQKSTVEIIISVPEGFHLYRDMMWVKPTLVPQLAFSDALFPKGVFLPDPANPERFREHFDKTITIEVPVQASSMGVYQTTIDVRYQGCKAGLCYRPAIDTHTITLNAKEPTPTPTPQPSESFLGSWFRTLFVWF